MQDRTHTPQVQGDSCLYHKTSTVIGEAFGFGIGVGDGLKPLDCGLLVSFRVVLVGCRTRVAILRLDGVGLVEDLRLLAQGVDRRCLGEASLALVFVVAHAGDLEQLAVDVGIGDELLGGKGVTSLLNLRL